MALLGKRDGHAKVPYGRGKWDLFLLGATDIKLLW